MVLLLLLGPQGVPPLAQDLADGPVVLVRVALVDQGPVPFAKDHEGVHGPPDVVLLSLQQTQSRVRQLGMERHIWLATMGSRGQEEARHLIGAPSILLRG